jgi:hypothetical protein
MELEPLDVRRLRKQVRMAERHLGVAERRAAGTPRLSALGRIIAGRG